MNENVKIWHLIALIAGVFVAYYLLIVLGAKGGEPPVVYSSLDINKPTEGTLVTK